MRARQVAVSCDEVGAWFDAGLAVLAAARRRSGWLYGRQALMSATDALDQARRVARAFGWEAAALRPGLADTCLDAVALRLLADLPAGAAASGRWAEGLLDAVDLRMQRLHVSARRRAGAVVVPRLPHTPAWGPDGQACVRVTVSPTRGWRFGLDGLHGPPVRVVAGFYPAAIDEVVALAVAVTGGAFPDVFPGPGWPGPRLEER
ncbi:hypothetical protein ACGFI9_21785 [Micromonospora sp. NPDC048930]|uniref:hypothetical protein n=1 Tax=Micromonospora sp. NPDC048930 TaxID=3364261 RepID=UPI003719937B